MDDKSLIERHGGATKLAALLGYKTAGGVQRVHNWTLRGIPSKVKLERPDLFPPQKRLAAAEAAEAAGVAS